MSATAVLRMASPVRPNFSSSNSHGIPASTSSHSHSAMMNGSHPGAGAGPLSPTRGGSPARALSPAGVGPLSSPFKTSQLSQSLDEALGDMPESSASTGSAAAYPVASTSRLPPPPPQETDAYGQGNSSSSSAPSTRQATTTGKAAPRNPLVDLIDTEHGYVDDLAMVIKVGLRQIPAVV